MQILFCTRCSIEREKEGRNKRKREERAELETLSLSLFFILSKRGGGQSMRSGQHVREAFLTRVTRRNRNPLLRRRFGLAHWLPVPVTRFGANWRPRLISKLQNIFTLLWFSTPPPPPLHSFALSLPPFFALPLCFLVTASSYRCYPLCTFFFSLFFFFSLYSFSPSFFFSPLHSFRLYPRNSRGFDAPRESRRGETKRNILDSANDVLMGWMERRAIEGATSVIVSVSSILFLFIFVKSL